MFCFFGLAIRMSHWRHTMVDGAEFWISCQQLRILIQNLVPSNIVWRQCDIIIKNLKKEGTNSVSVRKDAWRVKLCSSWNRKLFSQLDGQLQRRMDRLKKKLIHHRDCLKLFLDFKVIFGLTYWIITALNMWLL